jgi:hypothetical protein
MADTQNTSSTDQRSPPQTKDLLEMIAAFKEKVKLEGDYRDILKETIKESQKAIKDQLKSAAKIQEIGRSTINIKDVQKQIYDTSIKIFGTSVKINDLADALGGKESTKVADALKYNKLISQRQSIEDKLIESAVEQATLISKATDEQRISIQEQRKADSAFKEAQDDFKQAQKDEIKLKILSANFDKMVLDSSKDLNELSESLINLSEEQKKETEKIIAAKQVQYQEEEKEAKRIITAKANEIQLAKDILEITTNSLAAANTKLNTAYESYSVNKNLLTTNQELLTTSEQELELLGQTLTAEQAAYAQAVKTAELQGVTIENQKKQEKFEKEKSKQIGISGGLAKLFADKLGIGEKVYEAMTEEAHKLLEEQKKLGVVDPKAGGFNSKMKVIKAGGAEMVKQLRANFSDPVFKAGLILGAFALVGKGISNVAKGATKAAQTAGSAMSTLTGTGGPIAGLASGITGIISSIPLIGGLLASVIDTFANLLDFAVGATSKIQEMGREIGLSKVQAMALNNQFSTFATSTGKAYINSEKLFKTQIELTKQLGVNNQISKDNLVTYFELNKFLGVDAQTSADIEKTSRMTGRSAKDIAVSILGQVKGLQKATGISLNFQQVLKEASSLSGYLGLQFAKYPEKLTKSLLTTKALGLELKTLDGMADSFLDFETSIGKEFEAQLLTGKEVNLSKARELFLNNDLAGAAGEISRQVGTSASFMKENRIAAEAWAATFGMSRDQMADFLKQQEINAKFGATSTQDLQKKVALMRSQGREQEAINKLGSEEAFNKLVTASATEDLSGFIDKIKQSFADLVANTNLADLVQNAIKFLSSPDNIIKIVTKIKDVFGTIVSVMGSLIGGLMRFVNVFSRFTGFKISESMINMTEGAGAQIKALDVGNLVGYKKKEGAESAQANEASKAEKRVAVTKPEKIQQAQADKRVQQMYDQNQYQRINDIQQQPSSTKTSQVDQYNTQQLSISDTKSKSQTNQYNYKEDFKLLNENITKMAPKPANILIQNNATGPTAPQIATTIDMFGGYESSRFFPQTK